MAKEVRFNKFSLIILITLGVVVSLFIISKMGRQQNYSEEHIKLSELISASIDLAQRGGKRVVEVRSMSDSEIGQLSKGRTKEGKKEYVTIGDQESNQIIVSGLKYLWPSLPLQSEESAMPMLDAESASLHNTDITSVAMRDESVNLSDVTVWVDPLDATTEYTEGGEDKSLLKYVTVMVCIAIRGQPIAGVIHRAFSDETHWAWVGHGVSKNLQKSAPKQTSSSNDLRVIYSRSHAGEVSAVAEKAFKDSYSLQNIVAAGSGYKVLELVKGNADLYLHTTRIKKWDVCAGDAVLNAMGGRMTTMKGVEIDYSFIEGPVNEDGIVAAMPENAQLRYLAKLTSKL